MTQTHRFQSNGGAYKLASNPANTWQSPVSTTTVYRRRCFVRWVLPRDAL